MLLRKKQKLSESLIQLRKAKQLHKVEIKKHKRAIKKHKMLLKQAKLAYKITQQ